MRKHKNLLSYLIKRKDNKSKRLHLSQGTTEVCNDHIANRLLPEKCGSAEDSGNLDL